MFGITGYAIGGLGLIAVLAGGWGYIEHQGRQNAELRVAAEKAANEVNRQTIANLNDWRESNQAVMMELASQLETERKREDDERAAIGEAAKDQDVRKYLDTPIPNGLRRVLNHERVQ